MTSFFEKLTYNLSDGILTKKYKDCNIQLMIQKKKKNHESTIVKSVKHT